MNVTPELFQEWSPLSLAEIRDLLTGAPFRWWIAGGWAIDLYVGRVTRRHKDVEVAVLRGDAEALRRWLVGWDLWYVPLPGGLRRWNDDEVLTPPVHEIWGRRSSQTPWQMEVLVETHSPSGEWVYRRNKAITLPLDRFGHEIGGLPVVRPEVALLFKSKNPRPTDTADFEVAAPLLEEDARSWLAAALAICGTGEAWIPRLRNSAPG